MASPPRPFPIKNSTIPFWRIKLDLLDSHHTTETLPARADIVIIGAGYAGATTAFHLQEKCKDSITKPAIVILEAREACSGATGRNGGHIKPDILNRPASLASQYGNEAAAEAAKFEADHIDAIKELVENENIDCDFVVTRVVDVLLEDSITSKFKAGYDRLLESGDKLFKDVAYSDAETAEEISGIKGAKGCFTHLSAHIWPYKFVLHLLTKAIEQGANLQTHTPVQEISSKQDHEGYWIVTTLRGIIKAKTIVYASNAYTHTILPEYQNSIIPVRGICCRITAPDSTVPQIKNPYMIRSSGVAYEYLIPRPDGSIVVGGARTSYYHDLDSWYNSTDDSQLIESAKSYFDGYMQRTFKGWETSGATVDKIWTGIMGYSTDSLPHIGAVPNRPSQFILAGFSGHGMPQIFLSARGIASMIVEGKSFDESGIPKFYQTTQERLESKRNLILETWETSHDSVASR